MLQSLNANYLQPTWVLQKALSQHWGWSEQSFSILLQDNSKTKLRVTVTRTEGSHSCCCPVEPFTPRSFVWCCLFPGTKASLRGLSDTPQLEKTLTDSGLNRNPEKRPYVPYQHKQVKLSSYTRQPHAGSLPCLPAHPAAPLSCLLQPSPQSCSAPDAWILDSCTRGLGTGSSAPSTELLPDGSGTLLPGSRPFLRVMLQLRHVTELGCLSSLPLWLAAPTAGLMKARGPASGRRCCGLQKGMGSSSPRLRSSPCPARCWDDTQFLWKEPQAIYFMEIRSRRKWYPPLWASLLTHTENLC